MAKLETASGFVLETAPGAHHYRFVGLEFRPAAGPGPNGEGVFLNSLIHFGVTGADGDQLPHHFIVERCYLHGDPEVGTRRGIILNSGAAAVVDSYFSDFKMTGADSQAMIGWEGPGPYRIENNYLEAAGENLMFGGADPAVADRVPADIEIRRNHFSRPTAWKAGAPDFAGTTWSVKNLFELKNARRVRVEGNLFEYNWPESQNGFAILFTVRNQDGQSPWSVVEDVTFSYNIVRHVANGILILGEDDNYSSGRTRRIQIRNNLFEDLGGNWGEGDFIKIVEGAEDVVVEYNTVLNSGHILMSHGRPQPGFVFRSNIVFHNQAGIVGTDMAPGIDALERYFPDAVMRENLIVGGRADHYPDDNGFPESTAEIGLGNPSQREFGPEDTRLLRAGREAGVKFPELCAALAQTESPIRC
jgi:hypothetical protein